MLNVRCPNCGAQYHIPPEKRGKHAKCVKCGERFLIEAPPEPPTQPPLDLELETLATGGALDSLRAATSSLPPALPPSDEPTRTGDDDAPPPIGPAIAAYLGDVLTTIPIMLKPRNLATLFVIWAIYMLEFLSLYSCCMSVVVTIVVTGYYFAFMLNVVIEGAAREEDLPPPTFAGNWVDDAIAPLGKYLAVLIVTLLPLIGVLTWASSASLIDGFDALAVLGNVVRSDLRPLLALDPSIRTPALAMLILGEVMQPMFFLCVAVGGMNTLLRWDLMIRTILRTLPAYLILLVLYWTVEWAPALSIAFSARPTPTTTSVFPNISMMLADAAVSFAIQISITVFAMRAIGLYYHHFKQRFAWSWG